MSDYAVLIPVVNTDGGDALLMEVRSQLVRQPGEVCFPGGRAEPGETAAEAAVRETCEELGVTPDMIEVLSECEPLVMGDGRRVFPVKARLRIGDTCGLTLSEDEVEEVFLLPLSWMAENRPVHYDLGAATDNELPDKLLGYLERYGDYRHTGETDYIEYKGYGIWGLTARILRDFFKHF